MISLALPVDIYLSTTPADMRKSFDGLFALAVNHLGPNRIGTLYLIHTFN